jgi:uncharacterized protein YbjT (DUF2867 family)
MNILLTGATGYIGQRLLPQLLFQGHNVYCCVRDKNRFHTNFKSDNIFIIEVDFLKRETLENIPDHIDIAYYLIHSMSTSVGNFSEMEGICAKNFKDRIEKTRAKQVIYLSGIVNETQLSEHLSSRKNVEDILNSSSYALTTLRAGIIIGSGSASFEIIRDLVEKLPVMVTPRWLRTKSQPIAVRNVLEFLSGVIDRSETYNKSFDIGGNEILQYVDMLLGYASARGLKRHIFIIPLMTPKISSYWLYFITSTSYALAQNLVNSMKIEVVCKPNNLAELLDIKLIDYETSIKLAFDKIEHNEVLSSWKDAQTSDLLINGMSQYLSVPEKGCFKDISKTKVEHPEKAIEKIWMIGGKNGWYYADWLWEIRGIIDQIFGGVGLRRGRKNQKEINAGETIDFWRVLIADKKNKRLLLFAEMKLPGEAWLEFRIDDNNVLTQTATFRPLGLLGRLYWYSLLPFHFFIFKGMLRRILE